LLLPLFDLFVEPFLLERNVKRSTVLNQLSLGASSTEEPPVLEADRRDEGAGGGAWVVTCMLLLRFTGRR
jgi:hypothetical protein